MGVRLEGPKIATAADAGARPSEGVVAGAIQTPPDGFPIVLMADRQTTGGYPVAGVVATVDISTVAQAAPGARLQFVQVTAEEARALLCRRERFLRQLEAVAIAPESVGTSEDGDAF
jgi:allophanate hydrolase subunit 2